METVSKKENRRELFWEEPRKSNWVVGEEGILENEGMI